MIIRVSLPCRAGSLAQADIPWGYKLPHAIVTQQELISLVVPANTSVVGWAERSEPTITSGQEFGGHGAKTRLCPPYGFCGTLF